MTTTLEVEEEREAPKPAVQAQAQPQQQTQPQAQIPPAEKSDPNVIKGEGFIMASQGKPARIVPRTIGVEGVPEHRLLPRQAGPRVKRNFYTENQPGTGLKPRSSDESPTR